MMQQRNDDNVIPSSRNRRLRALTWLRSAFALRRWVSVMIVASHEVSRVKAEPCDDEP